MGVPFLYKRQRNAHKDTPKNKPNTHKTILSDLIYYLCIMFRVITTATLALLLNIALAQDLISEAQFDLPKFLYRAGIQRVLVDSLHKKIWISFMPEKNSFSEDNPNGKKKFEMVLNQNIQPETQQYSTHADNRPIKIKYVWRDYWIGIATRTNNQANPNQKEVLLVLYDQKGNLHKEQFFVLCPAKQLEKYHDLLLGDTLVCFYEREFSNTERSVEMLKINLNSLQIIAQKVLSLPNSKFGLMDVLNLNGRLYIWSAEIDLQKFGTERVPRKNTLFELDSNGQILHACAIHPEAETNYLHFTTDTQKNIYVIGEYTKSKSQDEMIGIFVQKFQHDGLTVWTKQYDYKGELQKSIRTSSMGSMLYTQGGVYLHKLFYTQEGELVAQAELFIKRQYSNTNFNNTSMFMGGVGGSFADPYTDYEYFDILLIKFDPNGNYLRTDRIPRTRQIKTYTGHLFSHKPIEKSYVFSHYTQQNIFVFFMNTQQNGKYHHLHACKYNPFTGQIKTISDLSADGFEVIDYLPTQLIAHNQIVATGTNNKGNLLWVKSFILE
ncbi:MAG: hypothetical protein NZ455_09495 [Bacteroidia bacterium]|nr:hypothetical protein [Bacteroidia bacterium]MDW8348133.1 hypothetical protein [Bacteroidia bacterium]